MRGALTRGSRASGAAALPGTTGPGKGPARSGSRAGAARAEVHCASPVVSGRRAVLGVMAGLPGCCTAGAGGPATMERGDKACSKGTDVVTGFWVASRQTQRLCRGLGLVPGAPGVLRVHAEQVRGCHNLAHPVLVCPACPRKVLELL